MDARGSTGRWVQNTKAVSDAIAVLSASIFCAMLRVYGAHGDVSQEVLQGADAPHQRKLCICHLHLSLPSYGLLNY
jgi:hypothetical protein